MIDKIIIGDILQSDCLHLVFAVNCEGINDSGFAGVVSSQYWPGLANAGRHPLGTIISHSTENKIFHACVVYDYEKTGWRRAPEMIIQCLKQIKPQPHEKVGILAMGLGLVAQHLRANFKKIFIALHQCPMVMKLFTFELDEIKNYAEHYKIKIIINGGEKL